MNVAAGIGTLGNRFSVPRDNGSDADHYGEKREQENGFRVFLNRRAQGKYSLDLKLTDIDWNFSNNGYESLRLSTSGNLGRILFLSIRFGNCFCLVSASCTGRNCYSLKIRPLFGENLGE